jgi:hypothetical protein
MAEFDDDWYKEKSGNLKKMLDETKSFYSQVDGLSRKTRKREREEVEDLLKKLKKQVELGGEEAKNAKELIKLAQKKLKIITSQYEVTGRIRQETQQTLQDFKKFIETSAAQYNYAQKIAKEYLTVSRNIGVSGAHQERLTKNFKMALPEVEQLGGSLEDVTDIMQTMSEESGRARILDPGDVTNIEEIARALNMSASETTKMSETFDLMGISTESMKNSLQDVYKESSKLGLNANKVVKQLSNNMKSIQSYSFGSGVRGMTEMAKQAVRMRIDVSDVLQMADKFYQPEAAIEAAANLQMLGGDIAKAFGDPFETMYMARNKPEELAKKLGDMTENMLQFNEETGRYELPAEARMQLKSAGDQLGINTEKMVEMARQTSKIKDLKMKFTSVGDNDMKENLASLAKFSEEKGEFVIQHNGEELGLSEISDGMAEEIMDANENEGKTDSDLFKNIAINTQTMSEQLASLKESSMATIAGTTDLYEITAEQMKKSLVTPLKKSMESAQQSFIENFSPKSLFEGDAWNATLLEFEEKKQESLDALEDYYRNVLNISLPPDNVTPGPQNNDNVDPGPTASVKKEYDYKISFDATGMDMSSPFAIALSNHISKDVKSWVKNSAEIKNDGGSWDIDFT